jgi:hypothetical protein
LHLGEVQASELTEQPFGCGIVSAGGLFSDKECSEIQGFVIYGYHRAKLFTANPNPSKSGFVIFLHFAVSHVICVRANPQVFIGVVQAVAVAVIDFHSSGSTHDFPVHKNFYTPRWMAVPCVRTTSTDSDIHTCHLKRVQSCLA